MYLFASEILETHPLNSDVFLLRLAAGKSFSDAARPGRFVMLTTGEGLYDPLLRRPFGIVRWDDGWFEVVIRVVGKGSRQLAGLAAGSRVAVHGPLGNGWPEISGSRKRPLLLVAGGIGIAAIAPVIFSRPELENLCLLFGAAQREGLVLAEELKRTTAGRLKIQTITDDGSCGRRGLVTELLLEKLDEFPTARVFACGPEAMLKGVQKILAGRGVEGWLSLENRMACGFGVCLGCVQEMRGGGRAKVCTEGPVLAAGEVVF